MGCFYLLQVVLRRAGGLVGAVGLVGDGGTIGLQGSLLIIAIERLHHGLLAESRVRGTDRLPWGDRQTALGTDRLPWGTNRLPARPRCDFQGDRSYLPPTSISYS